MSQPALLGAALEQPRLPYIARNIDAMADVAQPTIGKLTLLMGLFVILGVPLVGYLWGTISDLLSLEVGATRILISVPALLLLIGLLLVLYRSILGWSRQA